MTQLFKNIMIILGCLTFPSLVIATGLRTYGPAQVEVSSTDGFGRKLNKLEISVNGSIIVNESIRWDYSDVQGVAQFLQLKINEARRLERSILIDHEKLQSLKTHDDGFFSPNGQKFIRSIIIQGQEKDAVDYRLRNLAGVFLSADRISVEHVKNMIFSDYLSILVDGNEIIKQFMSRSSAEVQFGAFQALKKQTEETNEMIYFNLSEISPESNEFMKMFKLASEAY